MKDSLQERVAYIAINEGGSKAPENIFVSILVNDAMSFIDGPIIDEADKELEVINNTPSAGSNKYTLIDSDNTARYKFIAEIKTSVGGKRVHLYYDNKYSDMFVIPATSLFVNDTNKAGYANTTITVEGTKVGAPDLDRGIGNPFKNTIYTTVDNSKLPVANRVSSTKSYLKLIPGLKTVGLSNSYRKNLSNGGNLAMGSGQIGTIQVVELGTPTALFGSDVPLPVKQLVPKGLLHFRYLPLSRCNTDIVKIIIPM